MTDGNIRRLKNNITLIWGVFYGCQLIAYLVIALIYNAGTLEIALFCGITTGYFAFYLKLLYLNASKFKAVETGKLLEKVNIANILTMYRLSSIPSLFFLIILASKEPQALPVLLILACLAFVTDLFDGLISRKNHLVTEIGKMLDSFSDYNLVCLIAVAFFIFEIIPMWLFLSLLLRLILVLLGVGIVSRLRTDKKVKVSSSFLGKMSIFAIMVLFALELFANFDWLVRREGTLILVFEWITEGIIIISFIEKFVMFVKMLGEKKADRKLQKNDGETVGE